MVILCQRDLNGRGNKWVFSPFSFPPNKNIENTLNFFPYVRVSVIFEHCCLIDISLVDKLRHSWYFSTQDSTERYWMFTPSYQLQSPEWNDVTLIFQHGLSHSQFRILCSQFSRVDTDVLMEVAYSCNFLAVSDSSTCPDIGTSWCHAGIIEHFEIRGFKMTP